MAGTVTLTEVVAGTTVRKLTFDWTSDAAGDADQQSVETYDGLVTAVAQIPDPVDTPTDLYDVTVVDEDGIDVLHGEGANFPIATSATFKTREVDGLGVVTTSRLTLNVSNAGNAKKGKTILWIR